MNIEIIDVIDGLSNEEYHQRDEISSSFIKDTAKHSVYYALNNEIDNKEALLFGDYFHRAMEGTLEATTEVIDDSAIKEEIYQDRYKDNPKYAGDSKAKILEVNIPMTNDYKSWKYLKETLSSLDPIEADSHAKILKMRDNVLADEFVAEMMDKYDYIDELSIFAIDRETGLKFRVRPDRLFYEKGGDPMNPFYWKAIVDWKTCRDITGIASAIFTFRYDIQSIFYATVCGIPSNEFYFQFVEKEHNHETQTVSLSKDSTIERAENDLLLALDDINRYLMTGDTSRSKPKILEL